MIIFAHNNQSFLMKQHSTFLRLSAHLSNEEFPKRIDVSKTEIESGKAICIATVFIDRNIKLGGEWTNEEIGQLVLIANNFWLFFHALKPPTE